MARPKIKASCVLTERFWGFVNLLCNLREERRSQPFLPWVYLVFFPGEFPAFGCILILNVGIGFLHREPGGWDTGSCPASFFMWAILKVFIIEFVMALLLLYVLIFVDTRHVGP